jgi:hypothetical protein
LLKPRDTVELILIRHFVYAVWEIDRLTRYGTVSIERWYREALQLRAQQEKLQKARKEDLAWKNAEKNYSKPADIALLSKAIFQRAQLAHEQIVRLVPFFLEKYKDQLAELETQAEKTPASPFDIVPLDLKVLLQSTPETVEEEERAVDLARQQIKERDEFEAFEQ